MREFLVVLVGRAIAIVLALLTLRLSTHFLEPAQYGWLSILQAAQLLAIFFLTNPVVQYITRHVHEWSAAGSLVPRLRRYLAFVLGCSLLTTLAFALWTQAGGQVRMEPLAVSAAMVFIGVVALAWGPVLASLLNFLGNRAMAVALTSAMALAGLLLAILFVNVVPGGTSWFAGMVSGGIVMGVIAHFALLRRLPQVPETKPDWRADMQGLMRFSVPLGASAVFMWFLLSGYRLEFAHFWGQAELGSVVVGLVVAVQAWAVIEQLALQYLQPYLYRHMNSAGSRDESLACSDFVNILGPLYLGFCGLLVVNAGLIFRLLVAESYQAGFGIFLIAIYIELFRVVSNAFSMAAHVRKDAVPLIRTYALAAAFVALGIYAVGAAGFGILAACFVLLAGGVVMLAAMLFHTRQLVRFEFIWRHWAAGALLAVAGGIAGLLLWQSQGLGFAGSAMVALVSTLVFTGYAALVLHRNEALARLLQHSLPEQVKVN